jgi:hypothetical protein
MCRFARAFFIASTLALPLAGCGGLDPTDLFDNSFFNAKKPLPGDRKPLFPEGTPGVPQGVPPDLVKGYEPPQADANPDTQAGARPPVVPAEAKAKAKPKPKPPVKQAASQSRPTGVTVRPAQSPQSSPWPDSPPPSGQSQPAPAAGQGEVAWPDPPPPSPYMR